MRPITLILAALLALACGSRAEARVSFEVVEGVGLDDATPTRPVGGNPGRTLGAQRRALVERALGIWGNVLDSSVPIRVYVTFARLRCTESMTTLGGARAASYFPLPDPARPGAELAYPSALADRLAGQDLAPDEHDIYVELNGSLDQSPCRERFGALYYGFDGRGGKATDLLSVMLHELAHGLGVSSTVDVETGVLDTPVLDVFSAHIHDLALGRGWRDLGHDARSESLTHVRQLVFDGPETRRATARLLARGTLGLTLAPALPGFSGEVASAELPPGLTGSVRGPVRAITGAALCDAGVASYGGAVLLITGAEITCNLWSALEQAARGGAAAALLALPLPGIDHPALPPPAAPRALVLPLLTLAPSDAVLLAQAASQARIEAVVQVEPHGAAGADAEGRPFLFASIPAQPGSSISHFDPVTRPDLLMEPYSTGTPKHDLDLTVALMRDLGWTSACGNGRLDGDEACDAGDANADVAGAACRMGCRLPTCGDGVVDRGEACDLGSANSDSEPDGCRSDCTLARCGDGVVDRGESCDGDDVCDDRCSPADVVAQQAHPRDDQGARSRDAADGCSLAGRGASSALPSLLLVVALALRGRRRR